MENKNEPIIVKQNKFVEIVGILALVFSLGISIAMLATKQNFILQLLPFIFALLGLYVVLSYHKEYVEIDGNDITYNKISKQESYKVSDIGMVVLSKNQSATVNITCINKDNEKMFLMLSTLNGIEEALDYFDSKQILIITAEDLIAEGIYDFLTCLPYADRKYYKKLIKKL